MSDEKIIVGISQGDINGIGMEVIIKTFLDPQMLEICTPVVFSSMKTASFHRKASNIEDFSFNQIKDVSEINHKRANLINVYEEDVNIEFGKQTPDGGKYAFQSLEAAAYALAQGTGPLGHSRETFLSVQLAANVFLAFGIVTAAIHADRKSPRQALLIGALGTFALGFLFGPGLSAGSLWIVFLTLATALFIMGYAYGPLGSWLPTLFPVTVRYSGISVAFNTGGIIGGAVTPILAQMMAAEGLGARAGLLLSVAGALSLVGIMLARPATAAK